MAAALAVQPPTPPPQPQLHQPLTPPQPEAASDDPFGSAFSDFDMAAAPAGTLGGMAGDFAAGDEWGTAPPPPKATQAVEEDAFTF